MLVAQSSSITVFARRLAMPLHPVDFVVSCNRCRDPHTIWRVPPKADAKTSGRLIVSRPLRSPWLFSGIIDFGINRTTALSFLPP